MGMCSRPSPGSPLDVIAACEGLHGFTVSCGFCAHCEPNPDLTGAG